MKITQIKSVGKKPVYDLSVAEAEHYVLANGVVTHNSGLMYSANQAFIISKSQEKDGTELAGWKFTINVEKSRYVKEKSKLPFTVLYEKGIQKWSAMVDLALESGHLVKPKMGWYGIVDMETGEISEKSYRLKDIERNSEYFRSLLKDQKFKDFVEKKYKLSGSMVLAEDNESSDEDIDNPDDE